MEKTDEARLQYYIKKHKLKDCFDTPHLSFQFIEYHQGDMVIRPEEPLDCLLFVVEGAVKIYAIRQDGMQNSVHMTNGFMLLGDMEFITNSTPPFFVEAASDLICISLLTNHYREALLQDACFLRLVAQALAQKLQMITQQETVTISLEEKVQNYMMYHCENGTIAHMEQTAFQLHCSRRQLQRVLKRLIERGTIIKIGRGTYQLAASDCIE